MEYIKISIGIEQNLIINYENVKLNFKIRFNDYYNYWFFDLYEFATETLIVAGIKIKLVYKIDLFDL